MASLCVRCQSFNVHAYGSPTALSRKGYRVQDIRESAKTGCPFCTHLAHAFPAIFEPSNTRARDWVHLRITTADEMTLVLQTGLPNSDQLGLDSESGLGISYLTATVVSKSRWLAHDIAESHHTGISVQFRAVADPGSPAAVSGDIVGRYLYTGTNSTSAPLLVSSIEAWLGACFEHDQCEQTLSGRQVDRHNTPLPARCIYVWTDQEDVKFRLQDTAGKHGTYITVSHRWLPDEDMNSTTTSNLQSRLTAESFGPLPPLFIDTIALAARLEISYVWIDALCIVQGDGGEWAVEVEKMADYYQNTLFTIASPIASKTTGIFSRIVESETEIPDSRGPPLIRMPYRNPAGEPQGYFYLCPDKAEEENDYWENVANSELFSRGWIFQEWTLSRRVLCCTLSDVFFRCKDSPLRTASGIIQPRKQWDHLPDFKLRNTLANLNNLSRIGLVRAWMVIIEAYSGLKLTKPDQDRLAALRGVADEFGQVLARQDTNEPGNGTAQVGCADNGSSIYVAGLWLSFIMDGLLWEKAGEEPHQRIASIPSYSWASTYHTRIRWSSYVHLNGANEVGNCQVIGVLYPQADSTSAIDDPSFANGLPEYRPPLRGQNMTGAPRIRFPVLCLRTKLQPVILGGRFPTQDDRDLVASLTRQIPNSGRSSWRKIASHLDREHIAGWASLEHPEFQVRHDSADTQIIFALHVARLPGSFTLGLGAWMAPYMIFNVLFVRRVETVVNGYERVGVGALFGKEIQDQFETAVNREIRLL